MTVLDSFRLHGLRALVTGGASGIGSAIAYAFAETGAEVVIVGRDSAKIDLTLGRLHSVNTSCTGFVCDLISPDTSLDDVARSVGEIDILVNAAGVNLRQPANAITSASWDETQAINLKVPFFLSRCFIGSMQTKGWGRILNIASLQSERAMPNGLAYGASKGGVAQMTRAMAEEWSRYGINVNAIAPGFFKTPLTQRIFDQPELVQQLAARTAIGRNGELQDLYGIAIFLASRASDFITGQTIFVDGGFTAK